MKVIIVAAAFLLAVVFQWLARRQKRAEPENAGKKEKKKAKRLQYLSILFAWVFVTQLMPLLFGAHESEGLHVSIAPERTVVLGFSISQTIITAWIVMAALVVLAVLLRMLVIPRFTAVPHGIQNVLETAVEQIDKYTEGKIEGLGDVLPSYLFTIALFMAGCALVELFGVRAPTADITMTFAMALITFFLINYYGIKRKTLAGRFKSLAEPIAVVFPFRIISDVAIPVSLACRLFGNMMGGMVVMDLLYNALAMNAIAIPSVLGLYFNVFHPLIQAYIFITLTLTFISEAAE